MANPEWHPLDDVEVEGEIRCIRCNRRDFTSMEHLRRHERREHTHPVITGTLAYKKAQLQLQIAAQSGQPKLVLKGKDCDNVWLKRCLGQLILDDGDGGQDEAVQHQVDVMHFKFHELKHLLVDKDVLLSWRLQYYVTGVLSTALLHNVGSWPLDARTQRKLNGVNSRMLAKMTGRSVREEAREPTLDPLCSTVGTCETSPLVGPHPQRRRDVAGETETGGDSVPGTW